MPDSAGSDAKTSEKTAVLVPQPHGGALQIGNPGNVGGGRPPKAFKAFLAELRKDPRVQKALEEAATESTHKNFKAALDVIAAYDDEKPGSKTEHTGEVTVRIKRDEV